MMKPPPDRSWLTTECGNCGRPTNRHALGLCYPATFAMMLLATITFCGWLLWLIVVVLIG